MSPKLTGISFYLLMIARAVFNRIKIWLSFYAESLYLQGFPLLFIFETKQKQGNNIAICR